MHRVDDVHSLADQFLCVVFAEGITKRFDMSSYADTHPTFRRLSDVALFRSVRVAVGGRGVVWGDDLSLSCDELWKHGVQIETVFDGLMSFAGATELWGLSESTLRKAVAYGRFEPGLDVRKFGKQWVIERSAMEREYGRLSVEYDSSRREDAAD